MQEHHEDSEQGDRGNGAAERAPGAPSAAADAHGQAHEAGACPPPVDLAAELTAANARLEESRESYLRAMAETENIRRRTQEDVAKARKFAIEAFAESLLPVADSLEAALADRSAEGAKLREGVELTLRQLLNAFEKNRLVPISPLGAKFDPHLHQAISTQPAEGVPGNHVSAVLQKGWTISDRVLRPALVAVSQGD